MRGFLGSIRACPRAWLAPGCSGGGGTKYGVVGSLSLSRPPEYPEALLVIASAALPCGADQSVFLYDWSGGNPVRRLESIPDAAEFGQSAAARVSARDGQGSRLAVLTRFAVSCVSCWNGIGYTLFRLGPGTAPATILQSGDQGIYYCDDWNVRLRPDDFLLEFPGYSIDTGILIRTHVLHYRVGKDGAVRTDPVALKPQDFVDEWLTIPWNEMVSRSSASDLKQLEKWHGVLHSDTVLGDFRFVQPCAEKPGQWLVAVDLHWVASKELPEPLPVYFLIRWEENYRFQMTGISFDRQDGCPGESYPSGKRPSLFGSEPGNP